MARLGGLLLLVAGLLLRVWAIGRTPLSADVAVVGLMAMQILHGHLSAFYWGQSYGGGEPYVVAGMFALFGASSLTLALTPVVLDAASCILLWRLGRRLFSPGVGALAALVFWIWPPVYLTESTLEYGFRWLALCCGLAVLLIAARLVEEAGGASRRGPLEWAALGAFAGLGWWCSPEIGYFLLPAGLLVVAAHVRARRIPRTAELAGCLGAASVCALPWLWANVRSHLASLHAGRQLVPAYGEHLRVLVVRVVPMVLGLRRPASGDWIVPPPLGEAAYAVVLALVLLWCALLARRRRGLLLVLFCACFPFLYAASPFTWYWSDGRYALYLAPVLALLLASAVLDLPSPRLAPRSGLPRPAAALLVVLAGALTLATEAGTAPFRPVSLVSSPRRSWLSWELNPNAYLVGLSEQLVRDHVHDLYGGYWVAYPLDFESKGSLVAAPLGAVYSRNASMLGAVERSPDPAWLFARPRDLGALKQLSGSSLLEPGCAAKGDHCLTPGRLQDWLRSRGVGYRLVALGPYQAVIPDRPLAPQRVLSDLGLAR